MPRLRLSRFFRMPFLSAHTFNVIQLGIGFFFVFFAFNSQGFIVEIVLNSHDGKSGIKKHDGYVSMAIIYFAFTFCNFFAAPIVGFLNARWAIVFGAILYAFFQFGFLFLNNIYLYISSALIGLGAAVIWTAQGKYLSLNSTEETAGKHSGLFWALSQACLIFGGIFLFIVFQNSNDPEKITDSTTRTLYSVFFGVTILGTIILACLRLPQRNVHSPITGGVNSSLVVEDEQVSLTQLQTFASTLKLCTSFRILLLIAAFVYTGIELSFWSSVYPTCIANTNALGYLYNTKSLLALNAIVVGFGQMTSGLLFGIFGSKTGRLGRDRIVFLGAFIHLIVFVAIYMNFPSNAPLGPTKDIGKIQPSIALALLCGFLLGFGDACWNTQIFAFLISKYPTKSAEAFSLFKFFQSLLTCAAFFYSTSIGLEWHMLVLVIGSIVGCGAFFFAEHLPRQSDEFDNRALTLSNTDEIISHSD